MSGPSRWRLAPETAAILVGLAAVFWWYSRLPLHHTDLWAHLAYGRWICEHGSIPRTEPFLPLARDVPIVDTAWLSQVLLYQAERHAGLAGLQAAHAFTVAACVALLGWSLLPAATFSAAVGGWNRALAACVCVLAAWCVLIALEWFQLRIIRPQTAGLACFVALIGIATTPAGLRRARWLIPALFVLWANLHGSFVIGVAWLAARALGRACDVWWRTGRGAAFLRDRAFRRLCGLASLAVVAACINPYGWRLWREALTFAANPNLRDLLEWQALNWFTPQAWIFLCSVFAVGVGVAVDRNRRTASELIPLAVLAVGTVASARFIVWWGPLAARFVGQLVAGGLGRVTWGRSWALNLPGSGARTALAALAWAAAIVSSPLGQSAILGRPLDLATQVSARSPVAAAQFLRAHPPAGLVCNRYEWGDYLLWAGPPGIQLFVDSQVQVIPPAVWRDQLAITAGSPRSLARLVEYRVEVVLLDPQRQEPLARLLEQAGWTLTYVDPQQLVAIYTRDSGAGP